MNVENMNREFLDKVLRGETEDHWYHFGITSTDPALHALRDVQAVIVAGSGERTAKFASDWASRRNAEVVSFPKEDRFILRYADRVLFSSLGMGMPSAAIAMHELMKMTYFLKNGDTEKLDKIFWMRVGTSGGVGLPGGAVVVSTAALLPDLKPYRVFVQGKDHYFPGQYPHSIAVELVHLAEKVGINAVLGKTIGCNDFYLEQGRLDGAVTLWNETNKTDWLQQLYAHGVRNIEMETPLLAGLLSHWGFPRFAAACAVLLDRLKEDQVTATVEELSQYVANAETLLFAYLDSTIV